MHALVRHAAIAAALIGFTVAVAAAQNSKDDKTKDGTTVGAAAKATGTAVGDAGKATAKTSKDVAKATAGTSKKGAKATAGGAKKLGLGIKNAVTGDKDEDTKKK